MMAFIGQTGMSGLIAYSPWLQRGGDAAMFVADALGIGGAGTLDIDVEHRNVADTASTTLVSFPAISAVGVVTANASGVKELVRFKYTFGGPSASDWVHFRMLATVWQA
jgi:hypothetical protein